MAKTLTRNGAIFLVLVTAASMMLCLNATFGGKHLTISQQLSESITLPSILYPMEVGNRETAIPRNGDKIRPGGKKACPSQYRNKKNNNEHSPLLFKKHNLMVCRTPKVGSNELRSIASAYESDTPFTPPSFNRPHHGSILAAVRNSRDFNHYLYDDNVTRIMFVRHPVIRVLSGFLEMAKSSSFWKLHGLKQNVGASPETFRRWIQDPKLFYKYYHSECRKNSASLDVHPKIQHWAPPQHCRCGIHDCNAKWNVFMIEQHKIQSVLKNYLPEKYLPPANSTEILHKRKYTVRDYLADDILAYLNLVTKEEQEFFDYDPLVIDE